MPIRRLSGEGPANNSLSYTTNFLTQTPKMWYRNSPAELYYKRLEGRPGVQQTKKLEALAETFFKELIERGRKARPVVDEMPPLPTKSVLCTGHRREYLYYPIPCQVPHNSKSVEEFNNQ